MSKTSELPAKDAANIVAQIRGRISKDVSYERCLRNEAADLIERLQKELGEARDRENNYRLTLERLDREESTIRSATIEECAQIADILECRHVGREIRALNSNGWGKP